MACDEKSILIMDIMILSSVRDINSISLKNGLQIIFLHTSDITFDFTAGNKNDYT